jgi:hypothetical protein
MILNLAPISYIYIYIYIYIYMILEQEFIKIKITKNNYRIMKFIGKPTHENYDVQSYDYLLKSLRTKVCSPTKITAYIGTPT